MSVAPSDFAPTKAPLLVAAVLVAGCGLTLEDLIKSERLDEAVMTGDRYRHIVLSTPSVANSHGRLHIYVGGDGVPWRGGQTPSNDPTPRNLLELQLMTLDRADAVFIGRPCYFGLASDTGCDPDVWTFARFSDDVIESMASVARQVTERGGYDQVVLIGYSGGGALVRLMAPQVPHVVGLLTIAGNLDTQTWTAAHGYLPLARSRNPADEPPLDGAVMQWHVVGGRDKVVPASVTDSYARRDPAATVWIYPDYDHVCCWIDGWPEILARVEERLAVGRPATRD